MENTIFILLFICGFLIFLGSMGVDVIKLLFNFVLRSLAGMIMIEFINFIIKISGGNFFVNINEITAGVSGFLGIWGVILLYVLRYYFTIT